MISYNEESIENPKKFWFEMATKTLIWNEPCTAEKVMEGCDMQNGKIHFFDGKLNASGESMCITHKIYHHSYNSTQ